VFIY